MWVSVEILFFLWKLLHVSSFFLLSLKEISHLSFHFCLCVSSPVDVYNILYVIIITIIIINIYGLHAAYLFCICPLFCFH